jgi:hypothetical protein
MDTNRIPKQGLQCKPKDEETWDDRGRDGGTNFILRIKEQETRLILHEHDDVILVLDIVYEVEGPCVKTLSAHLSALILNPYKRRIKSHLPSDGIIRSSPYSPR